MMKSGGGNCAFNHVYPALSYSEDDNIVQQCKSLGFVPSSKRGLETPCLIKEIGSFCINYKFSTAAQGRLPRIDLNMQNDYNRIYI